MAEGGGLDSNLVIFCTVAEQRLNEDEQAIFRELLEGMIVKYKCRETVIT